jgi:hypothetical protein
MSEYIKQQESYIKQQEKQEINSKHLNNSKELQFIKIRFWTYVGFIVVIFSMFIIFLMKIM